MSGYTNEQISVGQTIIGVVKSLNLSPSDTAAAELDAIEGGLAESGLKNDDYGDYPASMGGQMSSSRGVYQQIAAWGPLSVRENVAQAAKMFLTGGQAGQRGLLDVPGWDKENSWNAVQAVQGSEFSDGSNYADQYSAAMNFINTYGAGAALIPAQTTGTVAKGATPTATPTAGATPAAAITAQPVGLFSGVESGVLTFALEALFVLTGLGLVVLGVYRASSPIAKRAQSAAQAIPFT